MMQRKKLPVPRLGRTQSPFDDLEGSDSTTWAVSYSDLLMVLMSFFVIFFSFNDSETSKNAVQNIALLLKKKASGAATTTVPIVAAQAPESKTSQPAEMEQKASLSRKLSDQFTQIFSSSQVKLSTEGNTLTVNFFGDNFKPRAFTVDEGLKKQLNEAVTAILPYKDKIEVVVVGHSDSTPFSKGRSNLIADNYDLSAFRALHILKYLGAQGLTLSHMSAQGDADNTSRKRSFSLKIQTRTEEGIDPK